MLQFHKRLLLLSLFHFLFSYTVFSQELFPLNEPASSVPKGVFGIKVMDETYKEVNLLRNQVSLRMMYGVLPRLSLVAMVGVSNHHGKTFPPNLVTHSHAGNQTHYSTGDFERGVQYPYRSNGIYVFAKYRFFSIDGQHKHFRMAAYADGSILKQAHDEAEPNLVGDTKGYGAGLITTCLNKHFAISLTSGFVIPGSYTGLSPDAAGGPMISTTINYGRAIIYNLSMGYLLLPHVYKNYNQINLNVYLELLGKAYEAATVYQFGNQPVPVETKLLQAGNYIALAPGIQCIFKSNLRIDLSVKYPFINRSYSSFFPVYQVGIQRYFYRNKKK